MSIDNPTPPPQRGPDNPTPPSEPDTDPSAWPQRGLLDINVLSRKNLERAVALEAQGKMEEAAQLRKLVESLQAPFLKNRTTSADNRKIERGETPPESVEQIHTRIAQGSINPPKAELSGSPRVKYDVADAKEYLKTLAEARRKAGIPEPPAVSGSAPTRLMSITEATRETVQMDVTKLPVEARPEEPASEEPKQGLARRFLNTIKKNLGM